MHASFLLLLLPLAACGRADDNQSGAANDTAAETRQGAEQRLPREDIPAPPPPNPEATSDRAIPPSALGRWAGISDDCADGTAESALTVTRDQLLFHESAATIRTVEPVDNGVAVQADFTGEGQSWSRRIVLRPSADGQRLTIVNDGVDVARKRCGGA